MTNTKVCDCFIIASTVFVVLSVWAGMASAIMLSVFMFENEVQSTVPYTEDDS